MSSGAGETHAKSGKDWRLIYVLMTHGLIVQTMTAMLRVTTSYRILELELPVVWLGAVSATFALLPVFLAVFVGRFIDRGHDARATRIGSALMLTGAIGLRFFSPGALPLLGFTAILGIGHLFLMASHQMICVRAAGGGDRDAMFANFLIASGLGQGLGPLVVGYIGGAAKVPETAILFSVGLAVSTASMLVSLALPNAPPASHGAHRQAPMPVGDLLRVPGFMLSLTASIITITAQDLIVIYLPLLGAERAIDVSHIGLMLTVRSVAAIVSRYFYTSLIAALGRIRLTFWSMSLSGVAYASIGVAPSLSLMYFAAASLGLGLGLASILSLTSVLDLAPAPARATALSLRITGNRIGQVSLPFLAAIVAAAAGAPAVMAVVGASLVVSAVSVHFARSAVS